MPLTTAGPNDRAGFIDAPVSGPIARMSAVTTRPMANPPTLGAAGSTAVPNTTKVRKKVARNSHRIAWPADSSSATDCPPSRVAAAISTGKTAFNAYAATAAPSSWAMM